VWPLVANEQPGATQRTQSQQVRQESCWARNQIIVQKAIQRLFKLGYVPIDDGPTKCIVSGIVAMHMSLSGIDNDTTHRNGPNNGGTDRFVL